MYFRSAVRLGQRFAFVVKFYSVHNIIRTTKVTLNLSSYYLFNVTITFASFVNSASSLSPASFVPAFPDKKLTTKTRRKMLSNVNGRQLRAANGIENQMRATTTKVTYEILQRKLGLHCTYPLQSGAEVLLGNWDYNYFFGESLFLIRGFRCNSFLIIAKKMFKVNKSSTLFF